jgi:Response regulator receiver domain
LETASFTSGVSGWKLTKPFFLKSTSSGGLIDFHSGVNKGTTFTVYLPTTGKPLLQQQTGKVLVPAGTQTNGSILIMADAEMIRELVSEILASEGYQVTSCSTGEEAITLYKEAKEAGTSFSAVIMDFTIPGGMGRARRQHTIFSHSTLPLA